MIIGQSPGAQEVLKGRPFVGPSGDLVELMLDHAEVEREEVYIANAVKCRPIGNRKATPAESANCWQLWLKKEIKRINPRIIMTLGKDAYEVVLNKSVPFEHGGVTKSKKGRKFLISYHPGYFIRRGDVAGFVKMGEILRRLIDGERGEFEELNQ